MGVIWEYIVERQGCSTAGSMCKQDQANSTLWPLQWDVVLFPLRAAQRELCRLTHVHPWGTRRAKRSASKTCATG